MDRNHRCSSASQNRSGSLSARRAWIEIAYGALDGASEIVALRKESVDRNTSFCPASLFDLPSLSARRAWIEIRLSLPSLQRLWSLSARRAWIEIIAPGTSVFRGWVALRKESVDRNCVILII